MAKQKISEAIQKQFDKVHFQIETPVFFSWLGYKQVGYVKKFKKASWGIQYTVESPEGAKYPCGIEIKGQKTQYNTGCIYLEDTRSIGQESLIKRFQNDAKPRTTTTVPLVIDRSTNKSSSNSNLFGRNNDEASTKDSNIGSARNSTNLDVKLGIDGDNKHHTPKRRISKDKQLDTAIQKQRDFLSGFVKKD